MRTTDPFPNYTVSPARYAKNMMAVRCPSPDGFKTRACRLAGALANFRYSNRCRAYIMSKTRAAKFEQMYAQGWDASCYNGELYAPPTDEGYDVAHDMLGFYVRSPADQEQERETGTSAGFDGRTHYRTVEQAFAAAMASERFSYSIEPTATGHRVTVTRDGRRFWQCRYAGGQSAETADLAGQSVIELIVTGRGRRAIAPAR